MATSATIDSLQIKITADVDEAISGVDKLTASLNKLKESIAGVSSNDISVNFNNIASGANKATTAGANFATTLGKISGVFSSFAIIYSRVKALLADTISLAGSATETLNRLSIAYGDNASGAYGYAQVVNEALGIYTTEWVNYSSKFKTLLSGYGLSDEMSYNMAENLTKLGYDLSSFWDVDIDTAFQKLTSGMSGQIESLKQWGYALEEASLKEIALSLGINESIDNMTMAEKTQLRYYAIMQATGEIQGDYSRTLDSVNNQLKVLKSYIQSLGETIGAVFMPLIQKILPYLIAIVSVITDIIKMIGGLFGIKFPAPDLSSTSASFSGASDAIDNATSSAKEYKRTLLGIDELNVLNDTSSGSSGSGDDGSSWAIDFGDWNYDFITQTISDIVGDIVDKMKEWLGITDEIDSWSELLDTRFGRILTTVGLIGGALVLWKISSSVKDFLKEFGKSGGLADKIQSMSTIKSLVITILGISFIFDGIEDAFKNGLNLTNFGEILAGVVLTSIGVYNLAPKIAGVIFNVVGPAEMKASAFGQAMGVKAISGLVMGITGALLGGVIIVKAMKDGIENGFNLTNTAMVALGIAIFSVGVAEIITTVVAGATMLATTAITAGVLAFVLLVGVLIYKNWDSIKEWGTNVINGVVEGVKSAWNWLKQTFIDTKTKIVEWFTGGEGGINVVDRFKNKASEIINGFKERIINKYTDVKQGITNWADSVKKWFTVKYDTFYEYARQVIQGFKDGIGNLYKSTKSKIQTWASSIGDWFKEKLGIHSPSRVFSSFGEFTVEGFNLGFEGEAGSTQSMVQDWADTISAISPTLSYGVDTSNLSLYNGSDYASRLNASVTDSVSLSAEDIIGNLGDFYTTYLEPTLTQMADDLHNQATSSGDGNVSVTVQLDGKAIGKSVVDYNNDIVKRTGASPLLV